MGWFKSRSDDFFFITRKEGKELYYFNQLGLLPIDTDIESHGKTSRTTLALGVQYNLSIYDAAYLELALRKGGLIATNDGQMSSVAKAAGIALLAR